MSRARSWNRSALIGLGSWLLTFFVATTLLGLAGGIGQFEVAALMPLSLIVGAAVALVARRVPPREVER